MGNPCGLLVRCLWQLTWLFVGFHLFLEDRCDHELCVLDYYNYEFKIEAINASLFNEKSL